MFAGPESPRTQRNTWLFLLYYFQNDRFSLLRWQKLICSANQENQPMMVVPGADLTCTKWGVGEGKGFLGCLRIHS
jgi:hypothetical protein